MEFIYFISVILGIVIFVIDIALCLEMAQIAERKGHSKNKAFVFCFFLWIAGILYVIALPNVENNSIENDNYDEIEKYKELLDAEIITKEEFNAKKQELMQQKGE